jgi:hypothetical protein
VVGIRVRRHLGPENGVQERYLKVPPNILLAVISVTVPGNTNKAGQMDTTELDPNKQKAEGHMRICEPGSIVFQSLQII